jgi:hypothetical protein
MVSEFKNYKGNLCHKWEKEFGEMLLMNPENSW